MKILLAPDKFKGSFSAPEIGQLLYQELLGHMPELSISLQPMADGGDGTAELLGDFFKAEQMQATVKGPLEKLLTANWAFQPATKTAFLDIAEASGLRHLQPADYNPLKTTTYGTGQLLKEAMEAGAKTVYLGVGGSATNDGGCGALAALGFRFFNQQRQPFLPTGGSLQQITDILTPENGSFPRLKVLCDVNTPFTGSSGASHTFAPQKGATQEEVEKLEAGMLHLAAIWQQSLGCTLTDREKSGAAGGLAGGLFCGLQATLLPGAETFGKLTGLGPKLQDASLVISGEGKLDASSLQAKVIGYLARECRQRQLPLWVVCGQNSLSEKQQKTYAIDRIFSLYQTSPSDFSDSLNRLKALIPDIAVELKKHF